MGQRPVSLSSSAANVPARDVYAEVARRVGRFATVLDRCDLALTARRAAIRLDLESGARLDQHLRSLALPPFRSLRDWWYVLALLRKTREGVSLSAFALRRGKDPAPYYRFVARVTGRRWLDVQQAGEGWVLASALGAWGPFLELRGEGAVRRRGLTPQSHSGVEASA